MNQQDDLIRKINTLRQRKIDFVTNAFFTSQQLQLLIDSKNAIVKIFDDAVIILVEEEQLVRLYFYTNALDSLRQISTMLPFFTTKAIIVEVVGRNPQAEKLASELQRLNFSKHNELIRMHRMPQKFSEIAVSNVLVATADKLNEIMKFIYDNFDVYTSHLPNEEKIAKSITNNEITIVMQHEKIVGLAYFEILGERLKYLYQIIIDKDFRGREIADSLLTYTFKNSARDTSFQLWVEVNNQRAISKYQKYNFVPDGLVDYIMIYRGE